MHIPTLKKTPTAGSTLPPSSCVFLEATQTSVTLCSEHTVNNASSPPSLTFSPAHENALSLLQDDTISTTETVSKLNYPLSTDFTVALNPNPPQKYAADFEAWCRERDAARAATKADPHADCNDIIDDIHSEDAVGTYASDYSISALSEGQTEGTPPPIPSPFIADATECEQLAGRGQIGVPSTTGRCKPSSDTDETKVVPSPAKTFVC